MMLKVKLAVLTAVVTAYIWRDTFDPESVRGARVLVTGASMGIGEQMAYHYARLGAQLIITARRESALQKVVERCVELGAQKALYVVGDMSDPADPERVLRQAVDLLGGLDYLVLNHIGNSPYGLWDRDVEYIRTLMQINYVSYVQMAATALPTLEQSGGAVVVVSSLLGKMTTPFAAAYASTKFALHGFFGTLQHELAMQGSNVSITISVLGLIDTPTALDKIRGYTNVTPYPASDAALHIIKAGATRQKESHFPWFHWFTCFFRDWFPYFRDICIQSSFTIPTH
ncbi:hydroxysteroid 11-beta-dehydrogenase 1-like protein isoform X1 [Alosa sapidissima]|uniref:hydroxysteroid 11-beta-dehydrogenase 1-like protein isoform X1 n=3 Tax=Alosa sapidissima TaxID=34773 RepID=UPI001C099FE5|nr:hydroxysteroid 11-beta-dehydrogenase 1-like protein isoform X1 [Alosa sapidissima]